MRYTFIDNTKGLCIFSVVLYHTLWYTGIHEETAISFIINTFYLTLFFIASGFVSKAMIKEDITLKEIFNKNLLSLLIPFFVIGSSFCAYADIQENGTITRNPLVELLTGNNMNSGFWFLRILLYFRLTVLLGKWLLERIGIRNTYAQLAIIFIIAQGLALQFDIFLYRSYLVYYMMGLLFAKADIIKHWGNQKNLTAAFFLIAAIAFVGVYVFGQSHFNLLRDLYRIPLNIFLFLFLYQNASDNSKRINRALTYLGQRSLDIYVLHFFFLADLIRIEGITPPSFHDTLLNAPILFQLWFCILLAILILLPTLAVSAFINKYKIFKIGLLGKFK
ncbi:MAG: acyltransferase [Prevotella sp.]|nr:acyltransferase [Prevotella sp.]